ncbi:hypothetical protein GCM10010399_58820 [Dactylosporangium fulvum]
MWCNVKTQNPGMKVVLSQINYVTIDGTLIETDRVSTPGPEHDTTALRSTPRYCPPPLRPPATCARSAIWATKAKPTPSLWRSRSPKTVHTLLGIAQFEAERDKTLPCTVVQIPLEPAAGVIGRGDDAGAGGGALRTGDEHGSHRQPERKRWLRA